MSKVLYNRNISRDRPGFVLLITLVLLVVLSMLGYTLSGRVAAQRHRDQYLIDYSKARYGCDSAVKYALVTLEEIEPELVSRPNEPDFSDLFALDEIEYQEFLEQWGWGEESQNAGFNKDKTYDDIIDMNDGKELSPDKNEIEGFNGINVPVIRGPYGPPWPFVTEPVEFEMGSTKVRIEIEDENAKYPLGWALLDDIKLEREINAGFQTFCEMMGIDSEHIDSLKEQLNEIAKIRPFKLDFKTVTKTVRIPTNTSTRTSSRSSTSKTPPTRISRKTIPVSEQIADQTTHFANIFHSPMIDIEALSRPIIVTSDRKESALKYMGMWGSRVININTAPRHVLEAAFIFGGDEVEIAEEIIQRRREEAFKEIGDLAKALSRYSEQLSKCEKYITTVSRFFTIKITAISGVAKASSIIAITKDGQKVTRIAVING